MEQHQKKASKLYKEKLRWIDGIINPLAEKIAKKYNLYYDVYGPFGLDNETTIYWSDKPKFNIRKDKKIGITLYPNNYDQGKINYWTGDTTNQYPKDSIGELNGFNNIKAPLPLELEEIIKLLRGDIELLKERKKEN